MARSPSRIGIFISIMLLGLSTAVWAKPPKASIYMLHGLASRLQGSLVERDEKAIGTFTHLRKNAFLIHNKVFDLDYTRRKLSIVAKRGRLDYPVFIDLEGVDISVLEQVSDILRTEYPQTRFGFYRGRHTPDQSYAQVAAKADFMIARAFPRSSDLTRYDKEIRTQIEAWRALAPGKPVFACTSPYPHPKARYEHFNSGIPSDLFLATIDIIFQAGADGVILGGRPGHWTPDDVWYQGLLSRVKEGDGQNESRAAINTKMGSSLSAKLIEEDDSDQSIDDSSYDRSDSFEGGLSTPTRAGLEVQIDPHGGAANNDENNVDRGVSEQQAPFVEGDFDGNWRISKSDVRDLRLAIHNPGRVRSKYDLVPQDLITVGDLNNDGELDKADLRLARDKFREANAIARQRNQQAKTEARQARLAGAKQARQFRIQAKGRSTAIVRNTRARTTELRRGSNAPGPERQGIGQAAKQIHREARVEAQKVRRDAATLARESLVESKRRALHLRREPKLGVTTAPAMTATAGTTYSYRIVVGTRANARRLTIRATTLPNWLTFADLGNGTAILTGTPTSANVGLHRVWLQVANAVGATAFQSFHIAVTEPGSDSANSTVDSSGDPEQPFEVYIPGDDRDRLDADGWTMFNPSADTRMIYVSSSEGDDNTSGLSPKVPVRSLAKGYSLLRDGYPDWVLLKRGDIWSGEDLGDLSDGAHRWKISGRSATESMLISAYGIGPRPMVKNGRLFVLAGKTNSFAHLAIVSVDFYGSHHDPDSPDFGAGTRVSGIDVTAAASDCLVEDCRIRFGVCRFEGRDGAKLKNLRIRRCVMADHYSETLDTYGIFANRMKGLLIEGSVFEPNRSAGSKSNYNICVNECEDVIIRSNTIARASNVGIKVGGDQNNGCHRVIIEDNLFLHNQIGTTYDQSVEPIGVAYTHSKLIYRNNVVDGSYGICLMFGSAEEALIERNIFVRKLVRNHDPCVHFGDVGPNRNITFSFNTIHDWSVPMHDTVIPDPSRVGINVQYRGNLIALDPSGYWNVSRSVQTYTAMLNDEPTIDSFMYNARQQRKGDWSHTYGAEQVAAYVRKGFTLRPVFD